MTDSQAADSTDRAFSRFYEQLVREAEGGEAEPVEDEEGRSHALDGLVQPKVANPRRDTGD